MMLHYSLPTVRRDWGRRFGVRDGFARGRGRCFWGFGRWRDRLIRDEDEDEDVGGWEYLPRSVLLLRLGKGWFGRGGVSGFGNWLALYWLQSIGHLNNQKMPTHKSKGTNSRKAFGSPHGPIYRQQISRCPSPPPPPPPPPHTQMNNANPAHLYNKAKTCHEPDLGLTRQIQGLLQTGRRSLPSKTFLPFR